jgi:hypothetical protein
MLIHKSNWNVWSSSFSGEVRLALRPSSCNYYSCCVTAPEARALSDAVLECAAWVERRCGGWYEGIFWVSSLRWVLEGGCGRVSVESRGAGVGITISQTRCYSVNVDLVEALELACRLWVCSETQVSVL